MTAGICIIIILFLLVESLSSKDNVIELYVLVDNESRIVYTGSYQDCKNHKIKELKLIKLTGVNK